MQKRLWPSHQALVLFLNSNVRFYNYFIFETCLILRFDFGKIPEIFTVLIG